MEFPFASGELSKLLRDIGLACKILNRDVHKAGLTDVAGDFVVQMYKVKRSRSWM